MIDFTITNVSGKAIGAPVEFIDKRGPSCILLDNETGRKLVLRLGLPKGSLMRQFTPIPPGGSIKTEKYISAGDISRMRATMVDITAKLGIGAPFSLEDAAEPVNLVSDTTLRIVGKDKADLETERAAPTSR